MCVKSQVSQNDRPDANNSTKTIRTKDSWANIIEQIFEIIFMQHYFQACQR
jgi:hypothetical protein